MSGIVDIYELAPMQQGMLFHSLQSAASERIHFVQISYTWRGSLEGEAFARAWRQVVNRHAILRTSFLWEGLEKPLQVVHAEGEVEIRESDLRTLPAGEQHAALGLYLEADRRRGFKLDELPLMRLAVFRMADETFRIVWTFHHILFEGWSAALIHKEVATLYEGFRRGVAVQLPPPRSIRDYIIWLQQKNLASAEAYWRAALDGITAPTPLGIESHAATEEGGAAHYREERLWLTAETYARLWSFARTHRLTPNVVMQGAWSLVLGCYSGQADVLFGTVVSGRQAAPPDAESIVGLLINTLPMRVRLNPAATLRDWLAGLQLQQVAMLQYEYSPLLRIQGWSQVRRGTPLFESIFVFENWIGDASPRDAARGSFEIGDFEQYDGGPGYPLAIVVEPGRECLLKAIYDGRRFAAAAVERMLGHMLSVLDGFIEDSSRTLGELSPLTRAERDRLLIEWNETRVEIPRADGLGRLFERRVEELPDAVAVVFEDEHLTYRELNRRANQLAHTLISFGVGAEARVALSIERSIEMLTGLLGIVKAGGVYVPLDSRYPLERLAFMIEEAQLSMIVTRSTEAERLPSFWGQVLSLDDDAETIALQRSDNPTAQVGAENAIYVSFTSGSTGQPKGVEVRHLGVIRLLEGARYATLDERQRLLHLSPLSFDASTFEIWGALLRGGCCILMPEGVPEPLLLARTIRRHGVTTMWLTASLFNLVMDESPEALEGVEQLLVGGEALSAPHVRRALERHPSMQLINGYGPTESTTFACCFPLRGSWQVEQPTVPIGRPISNTRVYVLKEQLGLVPIGVAGELYIGGDGLARGYLRRPELTAERFLPDPFSAEPGARLYQTGDLVRYGEEGLIEYLGRFDHQVKVRGFRIELGEIEAALAQYAGVRQVLAAVREDAPGDKRLVAYVVPVEGGDCSAPSLKQFLQKSLPEYMLPSIYITLDELPLTGSGKVDRLRLPAPGTAHNAGDPEKRAPRTPIEELLAGIWTQVLGLERVGVEDSFFDLGGHSLLATQVVSRLRELFAVEVSLRQFFETPSIEGLAGAIEQAMEEQTGLRRPSIKPTEREQPLPLSYSQQRLWFIEQLLTGHSLYLIPVAVELAGELRLAALEHSFGEVARRHEILRTRFDVEAGQPVQVIEPFSSPALPLIDLGGLDPAEQSRQITRLGREGAKRGMDLSRGPLMRLNLLRLSEERHVLLLVMHHIVTDGWSNGVLINEVEHLYNAFTGGRPSLLPELSVQYGDYAIWQRHWLQGEALDDQLKYWRRQLADAPRVLNLPTDYPRPAQPTFAGAQHARMWPPTLLREARQLAKQEGVTLFMLLMAAFQTLLYRYSEQTDICVGMPIANRDQAATENLIGFFVNTLVMRARLSPGMSFTELLGQTREAALGAYAHQDMPFEHLVEALQPERLLNYAPLVQVVLAVQNTPARKPALERLELTPIALNTQTSKFDLMLDIRELDGALAVTIEYSTDLFSGTTISRMLEHFTVLLEGAASRPGARLAELPLLTEAEKQSLLREWAGANDRASREDTLASLFAQQTARRPDAVAVVYGDAQLTYAELDARANQLANHLRSLGVSEEVAVGLCVERSTEMLTGLLGILKAGGVYVALDADYPAERLAFMLADAGVPLILTEEKLKARLAPHALPLLSLDGDWPRIEQQSRRAPQTSIKSENRAYVVYTSGSTGQPKGVCIPQRGVVRLVQEAVYARLDEDEVFLQFAPLSFDASTLEVWGSLLNGARLVVYPAGEASLSELGRELKRAQVTTLWLTAGLFHQMADFQLESLKPLRQLLAGGEALSVPHVRRVLSEAGGVRLINGYGPTENTTFTCCHQAQMADELSPSVPIGRPISGTQVYVLDPYLQSVPAVVPGELYAGGDGLAWGYLNRPELTAEKFVPHPFPEEPGARLYRTGDLARYRHDGSIEYLGRLDYQVKLRGFRLEPDEIAFVLKEHEKVREAVVVLREGETGEKQLVAYVVPEEGDDAGAASLRDYLRDRLPGYMVPAAFVSMNELPLTPHGKIDRRALPAPETMREPPGEAPARTMTEELLAGIWAQVLGLERVGVEESFFDLGGHSLLATQVVSRLRESLHVELPLRMFFERPTVAELAAHLDSILRDKLDTAAPPLSPVGRRERLPLSHAQQRLWILNELIPGLSVYNIPAAARLRGKLNSFALEQSFTEIIRRHEVLRTRFVREGETALQAVEPPAALSLPVTDLSALSVSGREGALARLVGQERARLFDLESGHLLRITLVRLSEDEHVVLLMMHHIVTDGWSIGILVKELKAIYEAFSEGRVSPLPELPVQYADYAAWQREWMSDEVLEPQLDYWRSRLADAPTRLRLHAHAASRTRPTIRCASRQVRLSSELRDALSSLSRAEGVSLFMTLLAAYQTLLYRYTAQERIPVGVPIANRTRAEIEGLIGFFVNMLVLDTDMKGDPPFNQLLKRVREVCLGAYAHQDMPFERLVQALRPERSLGHAPLVQATFTFHNAPLDALQLPLLKLVPLELGGEMVEYELSLILREDAEGVGGVLIYNADYFDDARIRQMIEHFEAILRQVAASAEIRLLDIRLPGETAAEVAVPSGNLADAAGEFAFETG